jgi:hypothetical protein
MKKSELVAKMRVPPIGFGTGKALTQSKGKTSFDQIKAEIRSFTSRVITSKRQVSLRTAIRLKIKTEIKPINFVRQK